jgi:hypothetical protein
LKRFSRPNVYSPAGRFLAKRNLPQKDRTAEIMFDGQKLLVPAHFVADAALAIIDCRPKAKLAAVSRF